MPKIVLVFEDFDNGDGGPKSHVFVDAEDENGKSINVGEWSKRSDGYSTLTIDCDKFSLAPPKDASTQSYVVPPSASHGPR